MYTRICVCRTGSSPSSMRGGFNLPRIEWSRANRVGMCPRQASNSLSTYVDWQTNGTVKSCVFRPGPPPWAGWRDEDKNKKNMQRSFPFPHGLETRVFPPAPRQRVTCVSPACAQTEYIHRRHTLTTLHKGRRYATAAIAGVYLSIDRPGVGRSRHEKEKEKEKRRRTMHCGLQSQKSLAALSFSPGGGSGAASGIFRQADMCNSGTLRRHE